MNSKFSYLILIVVLGLIVLAGFLFRNIPIDSSPEDIQSEVSAVEGVVGEFGNRLRMVSLSASEDDVKAQIEAEYGPFASVELIAKWKNDIGNAPGRVVSSPWPDRIEIVSTSKDDRGVYTVEGNVIEVTSAQGNDGIAAVYPVTLNLEEVDGVWKIISFEKGAYSQIPQEISLKGTIVCLPHRDTSGPITMECGFGLKEALTGKHYALDTSAFQQNAFDVANTGDAVSVEGTLVPIEQISSNQWQVYDVVGIVRVNVLTKI